MDADSVVGYFRGKSILITGSTGFLGKVLVEKILRVQPDVKKLYLLIRAPDAESAKLRIQTEIIGREIFHVLKEKHGVQFNNFIEEKICPLLGDIIYENFGLDNAQLEELSKDIDVIVNGAATTNFFERYDVAFDVNVLGVKHVCAFAAKCPKLKMLLHVSTAYVAGEQEGIIPEKPILMGETLKVGTHLDIESELILVKETMRELKASCSTEKDGRKTMKELGLKRTIDSVVIGYAKQTLPFFLVNLDLIMDVIPGDMVVNAMMVAMAAHSDDQQVQVIYHVTSSLRNPAPYSILWKSLFQYFNDNPPCTGRNGERVRLKKMRFFSTVMWFKLYMTVKYMLPLEMLRLVNIALCGVFSRRYNELNRKFRFMMQLSELYAPYTLFKGCFDDINLDKLRMGMNKDNQNNNGAYYFDFDPKYIDWGDYFYNVHIPGVLKYTRD
ncbi:hypothetical protein CFC21_038929 [Triticum aestivum]|uniref:Fatty acyl-CoA reductase n=3 Tax=Triticum TaxID=4564 RepID=A0A9R1Q5C5_TRITD|nr:hypothetical protein CFC21_038929 [Triticum aestivum]VAH70822.1 unnamed protein product [Triticum turgidum subsp. durum]